MKFVINTSPVLIFCIVIGTYVLTIAAQQTSDPNELINTCIDSKHHKTKPGPEGTLYGQCTPWKNRSCCTDETTKDIHEKSLYNFNFDHCPDKKKMSEGCRKHFMQDHCFYECSPNVGPWIVKESRSWRKERYYKVPLCESDCFAWFNDCKYDYTCTDNWSQNFQWINGSSSTCGNKKSCKTNICPDGSKCQTFSQVFKEPKNFCERVWDHAWEYTEDSQPCMRIWFDGEFFNPNDRVAALKISMILSGSSYIKAFEPFLLVCGALIVRILSLYS